MLKEKQHLAKIEYEGRGLSCTFLWKYAKLLLFSNTTHPTLKEFLSAKRYEVRVVSVVLLLGVFFGAGRF